MKKIFVIAAITLATIAVITRPSGQAQTTNEHIEWVGRSLATMQTIQVGMTRADVLKVFTEEGGLSLRTARTYVFRECPYIKVDVEFEVVGEPQDKQHESPKDRITRISNPYLARSILD